MRRKCFRVLALAAGLVGWSANIGPRLGHSTPQAALRYQHAPAGHDQEIADLLSEIAHAPRP